jgi:putative chitinase
MIDLSRIKDHISSEVYKSLLDVCIKYQINTPLRLCHFLAQCAHESADFKHVSENLNYSYEALLRVFPKYFNIENVESYVHQPVEIAARVYANRMGNGDEASLEGWFYRGRGYIQLTGKDNYKAFDATVSDNVVINPEIVAEKYPLESAAWFWNSHKLNEAADQGADQNVIAEITKKINGGYNGLENRHKLFDRFYVEYC